MQEEKSAVYTVILGVCLFLCLLMLGNMLMGKADISTAPAAPEEGDAMEFHITEDDIASVLTEALPFPVEDTAVKISRDGSGIPAWNSGTSRRRPYSGRTGKRCCWDNRSQQAKEKSLRKTEGISGM